MSIRVMTRVWDDAPFAGYTLMVLLALADAANDEGWCWPKIETIQKKTRCAERSVYQAISDLVDGGWVQKTKREGSQAVFYRVTPPAIGAGGSNQSPAIGAVSPAIGAELPAIGAKPPHPHIGRTVRNRKEPLVVTPVASHLELVAPEPKSIPDKRFAGCLEACERYAQSKGVAFQWSEAAGKQLKNLLKEAKGISVELFTQCLENRARSPVPHGEPPKVWLGTLLKYQQGPLDRFGKPEVQDGASAGNNREFGAAGRSRAEQRTAGNVAAAQRAYSALVEGLDEAG